MFFAPVLNAFGIKDTLPQTPRLLDKKNKKIKKKKKLLASKEKTSAVKANS